MFCKTLSTFIKVEEKATKLLNNFIETVNSANKKPEKVIDLYAAPNSRKIEGKIQLFGTLCTATPKDYHTGFIVNKIPQAKIDSYTTIELTDNQTAAFGKYTFTLHDQDQATEVKASYIFIWDKDGKIIHHHSANHANSNGIESIKESNEKGFETKEAGTFRTTTLYTGTDTITLQSNP